MNLVTNVTVEVQCVSELWISVKAVQGQLVANSVWKDFM